MRVGHFNIAVVQARRNFKPGININGRVTVFNCIPRIDVVKVGAGVDEAPVELGRGVEGMGSGRGGEGGSGARRLSAEGEAAGCGAALTTCLPGAA